ncbi:hypothetical protein B0H15DRAFT_1005696, partial [Mycena belliarum]
GPRLRVPAAVPHKSAHVPSTRVPGIGHRAPSSSSSPPAARPVFPPLEANPTPRPRPCHTPRTQSRPRIRATSSVCGLARARQLAAPPVRVARSRLAPLSGPLARSHTSPPLGNAHARCARPPCAAGEGSGPAAAARVAQRPGASLRLAGPDLRTCGILIRTARAPV